jgi:hypothetical protein
MCAYNQREPDHCPAVLCYAPASQCKPDNCQAVLSYAVGSQCEPGNHKMVLSYAAGITPHRTATGMTWHYMCYAEDNLPPCHSEQQLIHMGAYKANTQKWEPTRQRPTKMSC